MKITKTIVYGAFFSLFVAGCGGLGGLIGGPTTSFVANYKIKSETPLDVLGAGNAIAQETGFAVQESDEESGKLSLAEGLSTAGAALVGTEKTGSVVISGSGTKHLKIYVQLIGNFGYACKTNADQLVTQICKILNAPSPVGGDVAATK